ncbi:MAG: DUF1501 domain-containing protein [Myxococcales bacterium]|nr:DUF1501 domain-containing protein [Myxococcales bacterium]
MDRRDFFKLAGIAGLAVTGPGIRQAWADEQNPEPMEPPEDENPYGPLFIQVQAVGGWDPTMLCDPKYSLGTTYDGTGTTAGNIAYTPFGQQWTTFFETNYQRMVVINGVDIQTNNHDAGRRHMASGRLGEGHPNLAALVAGFQAPHLPIAFLSFGGYEATSGVVAPTRDIDRDRLAGIIYPDRLNPAGDQSALYHSEKTRGLIGLAREARAKRIRQQTQLPKIGHSMDTLLTTRLGSGQLQRLEELIPNLGANGEEARVQLAIAAYRAGVGTAVNFARGGFDTHTSHDSRHGQAMGDLLKLVNFIWQQVDEAGIAHRVVMLITSDFGRTPTYGGNGYNGNMGKDHWPISSMIVVSGLKEFQGNRTVGYTDTGFSPVPLDPETLLPAGEGVEGVRIRPEHVHRNLRNLVGMSGHALDQRFALVPEHDLKLF